MPKLTKSLAKIHFARATRIGILLLVLTLLFTLLFPGCDDDSDVREGLQKALINAYPHLANRTLTFVSPSQVPDGVILRVPPDFVPHCCETQKVYVEGMDGTREPLQATMILSKDVAGYFAKLLGIESHIKLALTGKLREWMVKPMPFTHEEKECCLDCANKCFQVVIYYCCRFAGKLVMSEVSKDTVDLGKATEVIQDKDLTEFLNLALGEWDTDTSIVWDSETALYETRPHKCQVEDARSKPAKWLDSNHRPKAY